MWNGSRVRSILPASILDRSRMSLMSWSRSVPAEWMTLAYSTCLAVRLRAGFCARSWARISSELSGVRSSWLMLARNSLLYFEASASCWARSSSSWRACSISMFLVSMSRFCWASSSAFSSSSALERWSSSWPTCSSVASRCDSVSRASVRALATMVLTLTPIVSTSCSRKSRWVCVNLLRLASSITPRTWSSTTMGSTMRLTGPAWPRLEEIVR